MSVSVQPHQVKSSCLKVFSCFVVQCFCVNVRILHILSGYSCYYNIFIKYGSSSASKTGMRCDIMHIQAVPKEVCKTLWDDQGLYNALIEMEYEILVPAYFCLLLNDNKDVNDFSIRSNVPDFGNMDDVAIIVQMKNGEEHRFAFQLRYRSNPRELTPQNFERGNHGFNVERYCNSYKNLNNEHKQYNFILYTNAPLNVARGERSRRYVVDENHEHPGNSLFNTNPDGNNVYKLEVNHQNGSIVNEKDLNEFFPKFSVYTAQNGFEKLKENILDNLKFNKVFSGYVDLFRKWHRGELGNTPMNKERLVNHLGDIYIAAFTIEN